MLSKDIIKLDSVGSTNEIARDYLNRNTPSRDIVVIVATEQTHGKGQAGNTWESSPGMNLTFSLVLRPYSLDVEHQFCLSMAISVAIATVLDTYTSSSSVKWPNDLYVANNKIGGILIENVIMGDTIESSIVGIGLNVNQKTFGPSVPNATSLALECGTSVELSTVLDQVLNAIETWVTHLYNHNFSLVREQYLARLFRCNELAQFKTHDDVFYATIETINQYGQLCVRHAATNELYEYSFKEIEYVI